ncbi:unnamed protein product [Didymodactylos carnosus]|uniref:Uncharacterized protein n=1 Tax=Didymodactylos carnosus TaxID=1234261 RepID=A0A814BHE7_9BILA|nr:unnamed protein product [Didymodactylos carnosus]CAF3706005.1 unnamed protein product [Didymodactylos carnosus]
MTDLHPPVTQTLSTPRPSRRDAPHYLLDYGNNDLKIVPASGCTTVSTDEFDVNDGAQLISYKHRHDLINVFSDEFFRSASSFVGVEFRLLDFMPLMKKEISNSRFLKNCLQKCW